MKWPDRIKRRDEHKCQVGELVREVAKLLPSLDPSWECSEEVHAHHITYKRKRDGNELEKDGITACIRCHPILTVFERAYRYSKQVVELQKCSEQNASEILRDIIEKETQDVQAIRSESNRHDTSAYAQRIVLIANEPVVKATESSIKQTEQD